jgi:hypothetical protein
MEFKGTKGKWVVTSIDYRNGIKTTGDDFMFIDTWNGSINPRKMTDEQARANAVLISKAPDMLQFIDVIANTENIYPHLREKAQQLIKEATEL